MFKILILILHLIYPSRSKIKLFQNITNIKHYQYHIIHFVLSFSKPKLESVYIELVELEIAKFLVLSSCRWVVVLYGREKK